MKELFAFQIPLASRSNDNVKGAAKFCKHCNKKIFLKKWDKWNNFLIKCPFCNKISGEYWNVRKILLMSFFINAFSFFFTMRFSKALAAFILFVLTTALGNYLFTREILPQLIEVLGAFLFLIAPMIINAIILLNHNSYIENKFK